MGALGAIAQVRGGGLRDGEDLLVFEIHCPWWGLEIILVNSVVK